MNSHSYEARPATCAALDRLLDAAVRNGKFLGLSYVVVNKQRRTLYSAARGYRNFSRTEPMTISTTGWLASMTKVMTCIAAMQVVERGLVGLDDDLGHIVPELGDRKILASFAKDTGLETFEEPVEKMTLRRLLSHSSGFAYDAWDETLQAWSVAKGKDQEICSGEWKAWTRPLAFEPGTSWIYGPGIDWAGKVIETVTHQSLEDYMRENIWSRVGMKNTTFHPEHRPDLARLEMGMRVNGMNGPLSPGRSFWPLPAANEMGGCGMYSSAEDYAKMLTAILGDDETLLKNESIEEFARPQLSDGARRGLAKARALGLVQIDIPPETEVDHALGGLFISDDIPGRRSRGSICWDGMSNPQWMIDRSSGLACVLLTQILPCPDPATKQLWADLEREVYTGFARGHVHREPPYELLAPAIGVSLVS